jgi:hypothetical protein
MAVCIISLYLFHMYSIFISVVTLNAYVAANFIKDCGSFSLFVQDLKQPETPRSQGGSRVFHMVELFSPRPL